MNMTIRIKLLLSFAAVTLVPIAVLLAVSTWHWRTARAELDRRFAEEAARACAGVRDPLEEIADLVSHEERGDVPSQEEVANVLRERVAPKQLSYAPADEVVGAALKALEPSRAIIAAGLWDHEDHQFKGWTRRDGAPGTAPLTLVDHMQKRDHGRSRGLTAFGDQDPDGKRREFVFGSTGPFGASGTLVFEVELKDGMAPTRLGREGLVFPVLRHRPWTDAPSARLSALAATDVEHGEARDARDDRGREFRVYAAVSADTPVTLVGEGVELYAAIPLDELYAPLHGFSLKVGGAVVLTLLLAFVMADRLSRRFVGDIERIRATVDAIGRGELARLDPSSSDELGGALVRSVNEMAASLAARSVREETSAWRRLVQVLSHEINNTLAPVRSVASTMRRTVGQRLRDDDAGADVDESLRLIVDRVDALAGFIARSAEVAQVPEPQRQLADFGAVVRGSTVMFAEEAAARAVALDIDVTDTRTSSIDVRLVERVIVNIVKNAVEAASTRVRVTTTTHGDDVELLVEDDGPGISADARRSLFVPYFTTKPGGSGIGLALARQIVVAHAGTITAEDREGGGTRMRVTLPARGGHPYRATA